MLPNILPEQKLLKHMNTLSHRGYTIYKQPQGGYYICGLKVVVQSQEDAVRQINNYLDNNPKARQAALLKEATVAAR